MNLSEIKSRILSGEADGRLTELYGEEKLQGEKRRWWKWTTQNCLRLRIPLMRCAATRH